MTTASQRASANVQAMPKQTWKDGESWALPHATVWYEDKATSSGKTKGSKSVVCEGLGLEQGDLEILRDAFIKFMQKNGCWNDIVTTSCAAAILCLWFHHSVIPRSFRGYAARVLWDKVLDSSRDRGGCTLIKHERLGTTPAPMPPLPDVALPGSIRSASTPSVTTAMVQRQPPAASFTQSSTPLSPHFATIQVHNANDIMKTPPIHNIVHERYLRMIDEGKMDERSATACMLSFDRLTEKLSGTHGDLYVYGFTQLFDAVRDYHLQDDDDLQSAALEQLRSQQLDAIHIRLQGSSKLKEKEKKKASFQQKTRARSSLEPVARGLSSLNSKARRTRRKRPGRLPPSLSDEESSERIEISDAMMRNLFGLDENGSLLGIGADDDQAWQTGQDDGYQQPLPPIEQRYFTDCSGSEHYAHGFVVSKEALDTTAGSDDGIKQAGSYMRNTRMSWTKTRRPSTRAQQDFLSAQSRDALTAKSAAVMEHCSQLERQRAAAFFKVPVSTFQARKPFRLPPEWGLDRKFIPYQLVEAYLMYLQDLSANNGGIFANVMGMDPPAFASRYRGCHLKPRRFSTHP
ncbi:hypothetical protein FB567DRAFT_555943 [Paraphoma chrysanthemicola]|uniref:Uncharacterized protein n=1 Tax=Paraphoma chrysanthemicola TaxID=798071 RepID=A0A8K0VR29_9PLEO|nr:hypothetical protein FB567DRAFT_555943 [Paraphoma chrysanthemicola]